MLFSHTALLAVLGYAAGITAHGRVQSVRVNGKTHDNYKPTAPVKKPTIGWQIPRNTNNGYLNPSAYENPDIICHIGATPGQLSVTVEAGESIALQWTQWPPSHHGNMINYLANCHGECEHADKTKLQFNKVTEKGLLHPNPKLAIGEQIDGTTTGYWAGDELIDNGDLTWFEVPGWLAPGNYVLRHELIALHDAMDGGTGIQHVPQCINLIVTGEGNDSLESGTLGTDLYRADQPGVVVNIFANPGEYVVPGPELYRPGSSGSAPKESSKAASKSSPSATLKGDSGGKPGKTSLPQVTTSLVAYQNTTVASTFPQKTSVGKIPSNTQDAGAKATSGSSDSETKKNQGPTTGSGDASTSEKNQNYDYDLPKDSNSGKDHPGEPHKSDEYNYKLPQNPESAGETGPAPVTDSKIADVQSAAGSGPAPDVSPDLSIAGLLNLLEKTVKALRHKLVGKHIVKRHTRDFAL